MYIYIYMHIKHRGIDLAHTGKMYKMFCSQQLHCIQADTKSDIFYIETSKTLERFLDHPVYEIMNNPSL